jgi:hypothetical protein
MSELNSARLKAIQTKLQNLVACVVAKAAEDPAFAHELEEVLLSDSLKRKLASPSGKSKRNLLSAVTVLHTKGENGLRAELEMLTDDELRRVARAEGLFKGRDLKTISRAELLAEIISSAQRRLTQGESFLKNS